MVACVSTSGTLSSTSLYILQLCRLEVNGKTFFTLAVCAFPGISASAENSIMDSLIQCFETFLTGKASTVGICPGDFNCLDTLPLVQHARLQLLNSAPTRLQKSLDKVFGSCQSYSKSSENTTFIFSSDHDAVIRCPKIASKPVSSVPTFVICECRTCIGLTML